MKNGLVILVPIYNDWLPAARLVKQLDEVLVQHCLQTEILLVDDGSTQLMHAEMTSLRLRAIEQVQVLRLRRNVGHQRAIAIGLTYVEENMQGRALVVMDGDGEDDPSDIPRMVAKMEDVGEKMIVFAERTKRSESLTFRVFYYLYRMLHLLLTGMRVRVGNFSVIPWEMLVRLVVVSELWSHYAAAVIKSRLLFETVPTQRAKRIDGRSHMNFATLVLHGLSAISVFGELVGVRLLVAAGIVTSALLMVFGGLVVAWFTTDLHIARWFIASMGLLMVLASAIVALAAVFAFLTLYARSNMSFLPLRDYAFFVYQRVCVYPSVDKRPGQSGNAEDLIGVQAHRCESGTSDAPCDGFPLRAP
ncbi:MAG: glycosyltransferase [Tepidisphaeraceae bacterium]|jgi:glycosyltransferase involved in cell wall biosynthesis